MPESENELNKLQACQQPAFASPLLDSGTGGYPAEIEAELHKVPDVADVAVFGIHDDEYGESICAVVQPQPGASLTELGVRTYRRAQGAGYNVPTRVEFSADLPREDSGRHCQSEIHRRLMGFG